jgi:hypothetical protein
MNGLYYDASAKAADVNRAIASQPMAFVWVKKKINLSTLLDVVRFKLDASLRREEISLLCSMLVS